MSNLTVFGRYEFDTMDRRVMTINDRHIVSVNWFGNDFIGIELTDKRFIKLAADALVTTDGHAKTNRQACAIWGNLPAGWGHFK